MGAAEFSSVLMGTESLFCFRSIGCNFESYTAHHTPPLSALFCKKQQHQKTLRAQQYTSSLLIPHGKLNVKHHRTNFKSKIHFTAEKETAWRVNRAAAKRTQAVQQLCEDVCIQARPISTNPGSVEEAYEYGQTRGTCFTTRRIEVVAVVGLLRIYFVVCFGCGGTFSCFFFSVFFSSNAHGLLLV